MILLTYMYTKANFPPPPPSISFGKISVLDEVRATVHRQKTSDWSTRDQVTLPNSKWRLYLHRLFIPGERRFIAASYELQMHRRIFLE